MAYSTIRWASQYLCGEAGERCGCGSRCLDSRCEDATTRSGVMVDGTLVLEPKTNNASRCITPGHMRTRYTSS